MPPASTIRAERLVLIPATVEMLVHDRGDRRGLARLLDAVVPAAWPPPLLDEETISQFIRMMADGSDPNFCSWYWVRSDRAGKERTLIGCGGTGSWSGTPDAVMIGYSVLGGFQNQGYATEAIRCIAREVFSWPGIRKIIATTYPDLKASIRVLEKVGFVPAGGKEKGEGMEEGTVVYILQPPPRQGPGKG